MLGHGAGLSAAPIERSGGAPPTVETFADRCSEAVSVSFGNGAPDHFVACLFHEARANLRRAHHERQECTAHCGEIFESLPFLLALVNERRSATLALLREFRGLSEIVLERRYVPCPEQRDIDRIDRIERIDRIDRRDRRY